MNNQTAASNPMETEPIGKLMVKFAVPAILSNLVSALYNIVDQIFIGQSVGTLGIAAVNVVFPLVMISVTFAMMFGVGGASNFSLRLGEGNTEKAAKTTGNSIFLLVISGLVLAVIASLFLKPMMSLFGASDTVLEYSLEYARIIVIGLPFDIICLGGVQLIRADGSPRYAMFSALLGAVMNTILDPIFIFWFNMGMTGAALATVIAQIASCIAIVMYFKKFKLIKLRKEHFKPRKDIIFPIFSLGFSSGLHQLAVTCFQIVMNNTLVHYGALSEYGKDIPLACVGVVSKVNVVFSTVAMAIAQSCQPIIGYNFGAGNYGRVKKTYKTAFIAVATIGVVFTLCYQLFPMQIIRIFGDGDELYFQFAMKYFKIFMSLIILVGIQILTSNFFPAIGHAKLGIITSLSRQIFLLLPLIVILPMFFGIDGVLYAGPISDCLSCLLAVTLVIREMKKWPVENSITKFLVN